jgi:hypothetical protein
MSTYSKAGEIQIAQLYIINESAQTKFIDFEICICVIHTCIILSIALWTC